MWATIDFLPIFEQVGYVFGEWVTKEGYLPYFSSSDAVSDFTKKLYDQNIVFSFDWGSWAETEAKRYINAPATIESADLLTLRKLLAALVSLLKRPLKKSLLMKFLFPFVRVSLQVA